MSFSETPLSPTTTACDSEAYREPKKLVLCFDGTGNEFSGSNADTNVVKLLKKLDRNITNQYHYYQSTSLLPSRVLSLPLLTVPSSRDWNLRHKRDERP